MSTKARVRNFSSTNSFAMYRWASSIRLDGVALAGITTASIFTLIAAGFETNIGDADLARSFPHTTPRRILTQAVVDGLNREGLYIIDNVLSREELIAAHAGAEAVFTEGRMDITTNHSSIRQDRVCWVRELDGVTSSDMTAVKELHPGMLFCVQLLRGLSTELEDLGYNRSFNHLVPKQCQLSRYAGDGSDAYRAHRDAARSNDFWEIGLLEWLRTQDYRSRRVTVILYLNLPGWDHDLDGGELRCYLNCDPGDITGSSSSAVRKINPSGGTLVIFDSTYLLHEVAPSKRDRYALTIWITGDSPAA